MASKISGGGGVKIRIASPLQVKNGAGGNGNATETGTTHNELPFPIIVPIFNTGYPVILIKNLVKTTVRGHMNLSNP